ncbi:MAG: hypothetical protein HC796_01925 [Synechococcaceae cyanobacterium RL_1_2]|nr:hypothetical protein [Synechococcaceae cyanobacterium RL_1_2]
MTDQKVRSWSSIDIAVFEELGSHLKELIKFEHLQTQAKSLAFKYQTLKEGLSQFWSSAIDRDSFEQKWLAYLADLLNAKVAMIISWDNPKPDHNLQTHPPVIGNI